MFMCDRVYIYVFTYSGVRTPRLIINKQVGECRFLVFIIRSRGASITDNRPNEIFSFRS